MCASIRELAGRRAKTYTGVIRLATISDLHVDSHPEVVALVAAAIERLAPDVLVIPGDLTADDALLERTLAALRPGAREAIFIPGNHDLWCRAGEPDSRARYQEIVPRRARDAGYHVPFADGPVRLSGHRFVGVTGWYDYSLRNRALDDVFTAEHYARGRYRVLTWSDKQRIAWPGDDGAPLGDPAICAEMVAALEGQLAAAPDEPTVVVTHHLPFAELVTHRQLLPWDFIHGFLGSARLGEAIARAPGVRLAIAGHTHARCDATIEIDGRRLRAMTSPLGYPREYRRAGRTLAEQVEARVALVEL